MIRFKNAVILFVLYLIILVVATIIFPFVMLGIYIAGIVWMINAYRNALRIPDDLDIDSLDLPDDI